MQIFDDPIELSKWRLIDGFDSKNNTLKFKFTLAEVLSSAKTSHNLYTWNYAQVKHSDQLAGVRFHQSPEPAGNFILIRQ